MELNSDVLEPYRISSSSISLDGEIIWDLELNLDLFEDEVEHIADDGRLAVRQQCFKSSPINVNALSKHASTYELERFKKNVMIIFNQKYINGHKTRHGTEKDVEALTKTFGKFGFHVVEHKDLTKNDLMEQLDKFSKQDFTDYGCIAVAVLTHGSKDGMLRAKDQQYSEVKIINRFKVWNNPTLVTKPRIIIIQACRGTKIVPAFQIPGTNINQLKGLDEVDAEPYTLPVESDILVLHSTNGGSPAHRDVLHGSWFIQELCRKINSLASTQDLESIITVVKRAVAIDKELEVYNTRTLQMEVNKQMPVVTSTLIRKLFLRKYEEVPATKAADRKRGSAFKAKKNDVLDNSSPTTACSWFHYFMRNCLK